MRASLVVAVSLVSLVLTTRAQEQATPPKANDNSQEEAAYENVNSFDPQSLQSFLKTFPYGKHSQNAKDALELLTIVEKIKSDKIVSDYVIPFENIGGAGGWAGPGNMGFTGYLIQRQGNYTTSAATWAPFDGGKTPGMNIISFDSNGNPRVADTDGSIISFTTDGIEYVYYGGVKFRTPGAGPAFFAVLKGKGFVHLKGAVTVTVKGKAPVDLAASAPVESTGLGAIGLKAFAGGNPTESGGFFSHRLLVVGLYSFIILSAFLGYFAWRRSVRNVRKS
jgi:hypothetical protein